MGHDDAEGGASEGGAEPPDARQGFTRPGASPFAEPSFIMPGAPEPVKPAAQPPTWSVVFRAVWSWDLLAISLVYFVEGIMDMNLLAIAYFVKDTLGLGPAEAGVAQAAASLPWEITPLLGLLTDAVPILGYHRKAYLLIIGVVGCCCWLVLPQCVHTVQAISVIALANVCTAWSQVIADAVMVRMSQGREQDVASFYQGLSWTSYTAGAVLSALIGGALIEQRGPTVAFQLGAAGLLLDALCAFLITEQRHPPAPGAERSVVLSAAAVEPSRRASLLPRDGGVAPPSPTTTAVRFIRKASGISSPARGGACSPRTTTTRSTRKLLLTDRAYHRSGHLAPDPERGASLFTPSSPYLAPQDSLRQALLPSESDAATRTAARSADFADGSAHGGPPGVAWGETVVVPLSPDKVALPLSKGSYLSTVGTLLGLVVKTIGQPQILIPSLFVFLWQASPSPSTAMLYFQINVLGFNAGFLEMVQLCGYLSGFVGLAMYQLFLVNKPMGAMLLGCALVGTALNATQLILVTRLNKRWGVPDKAFVLGDYTMMNVLSEVMMTPLMALAARHCPEGAEATMYSAMYMILYWSSALATAFGAALTRAFGVSDTNFDSMPSLMLACNLCMLLPLPVLLFMPDSAVLSAAPGSAMHRVASCSDWDRGAPAPAGTITTALSVRRLVPLTPAVSYVQIVPTSDVGDEENGGDRREEDQDVYTEGVYEHDSVCDDKSEFGAGCTVVAPCPVDASPPAEDLL